MKVLGQADCRNAIAIYEHINSTGCRINLTPCHLGIMPQLKKKDREQEKEKPLHEVYKPESSL